MRNERYDEAATALRRCNALEPTNVGVMYNIGVAYEKQNKLDESVDWLIKVCTCVCVCVCVCVCMCVCVCVCMCRCEQACMSFFIA
jgi:hypothetical protein